MMDVTLKNRNIMLSLLETTKHLCTSRQPGKVTASCQ
jgi:hypothetical protein